MAIVKTRGVCTKCRKSFSQINLWTNMRTRHNHPMRGRTTVCPLCNRLLTYISCSISIPKKKNDKGWKYIKSIEERLLNRNLRFQA